MQYSTLRVSALVAIFSASTALAYLDCGGGRAPPKTTVPGCPGYVGPTSVASTSLSPAPSAVASSSSADWGSEDSDSEGFTLEDQILNQFVESTGVNDGLCQCSGYLCEFARPGCVSINKDGVHSTITANPGYQSRTFDINAFSSYIASAGAAMYYSADGDIISLPAGPVLVSKTSAITTGSASTSSHSNAATSTTTGASSTGQNTTMATATATATANTTFPGNTTEPPPGPVPNGASTVVSALSSLAVILGLGMGAMAWL